MPLDNLLAYCAGIIDGDGCISVRSEKIIGNRLSVSHRIRIIIEMREPESIDCFISIFGGKRTIKFSRNPKHNDLWHWQADDKKAFIVLNRLFPFLLVKKRIASLAIELGRLKYSRKRTPGSPKNTALTFSELDERNKLVERIKILNHRGRHRVEVSFPSLETA